ADEASSLKWRRVLARRVLLNRIHMTIVPSQTLLDVAARRFRLRPDKVTLIPNGVDVAKFRPRREFEWRRACGIPDQAIVFGAVGWLRPEKNLQLLIRAFAAA